MVTVNRTFPEDRPWRQQAWWRLREQKIAEAQRLLAVRRRLEWAMDALEARSTLVPA